MKSLRVKDARFRILKGGKIGLSLSISLIGSALIFGNINSYATDYFNSVQVSTSSITDGNVTLEKATNSSSITSNVSSSAGDIVFAPTSWATSTYSGLTAYLDIDGNGNSGYVFFITWHIFKKSLTYRFQVSICTRDGSAVRR